jgi:hypothetical protein
MKVSRDIEVILFNFNFNFNHTTILIFISNLLVNSNMYKSRIFVFKLVMKRNFVGNTLKFRFHKNELCILLKIITDQILIPVTAQNRELNDYFFECFD